MTSHKIGIIGLGHFSTQYYQSELHRRYNKIQSGYATFSFLLYQVDFNLINPYLPSQFDILVPTIQKMIDNIHGLNIEHLIVPNITLHETIDKLDLPFQLIHPIDLALEKISTSIHRSIVLFGTRHTMSSGYIIKKFQDGGIDVLTPSKDDIQAIDIIRQKIYAGTATPTDRQTYLNLQAKYAAEYPIVIACTELSLWSSSADDNRIVDMASLQIDQAIRIYTT